MTLATKRPREPETTEQKARRHIRDLARWEQRRAAAALVPREYKPKPEPTGVIYRPPMTDEQRAQKAQDQRAKRAHNPPTRTQSQAATARRQYANALKHERAVRRVVVKALVEGSLGYTSPYYDMTVEEAQAVPMIPRDSSGQTLRMPPPRATV